MLPDRSQGAVPGWDRRGFIGSLAAGALAAAWAPLEAADEPSAPAAVLPHGIGPGPVSAPHFPSRLHACVWRNWPLIPAGQLARVLGAPPRELRRLARLMGLRDQPRLAPVLLRRGYITVIRRNWHLLPYSQLLELLGWNADRLAYTLQEDDFLWIKLGGHKPDCPPLRWHPPTGAEEMGAAALGRIVRSEIPDPANAMGDQPFTFVRTLSETPLHRGKSRPSPVPSSPLRFCYSYFASYGDPLLEPGLDPYPDGYLARLAACGVTGVWLQGVLSRLSPFPWQPSQSVHHGERRRNLAELVRRADHHGIRVFLYLNEPRSLPNAFFTAHPELRGVTEGDRSTLCTSHPDVAAYLTGAIHGLCRAVPDLGGFFTITASENLTNCWSHGAGAACPRCARPGPAAVIAGVNSAVARGIASAGGKQRLIAWDWGWGDGWAGDAIRALPRGISLMSVSEWSLPIERGGVKAVIGEYSLSTIGPGPRARRHWAIAREQGLRTVAKIQAANSWELSPLPYLPVLENVALHAGRLRHEGLEDVMLGWTLGGYPSPNLEVVAEVMAGGRLEDVAARRFGPAANAVLTAWRACSEAFREFPFDGGVVYSAPLQLGPANPLWEAPTGHAASMVGFPHDALDAWRGPYPPEIFSGQMRKMEAGFSAAARHLAGELGALPDVPHPMRRDAEEQGELARVAALHFRSVANQSDFVRLRRLLSQPGAAHQRSGRLDEMERLLEDEIAAAKELHGLQCRDSRIGFEASNHYFYLPVDLAEKVLNCRDLLTRWLPVERRLPG